MDLAPNLLVTLIMNKSLKLSRPQFSHPQYILVKSEIDSQCLGDGNTFE